MTTALEIFETSEKFYSEQIQKFVASMDWVNAHLYQGFLFGIQAYYHNSYGKPYSTHRSIDWAIWNMNGAFGQEDYGKFAWWKQYIQGYEYMENKLKEIR